MIKVPFLSRHSIESEAQILLNGYGQKYGLVKDPPVPVDDILNVYLRVTLDFDDLAKILNTAADVFGATWIERQQVIIDQSLDPTNHPESIGRYNFTVGHETGHWQLHRKYFVSDPNQSPLFEHEQRSPTVVCRTSDAKEPIEWQADYFSACLLMPQEMVRRCWQSKYSVARISTDEIRREMYSNSVSPYGRDFIGSDDSVIERFAKPLSRDFAVSPIAMRIRLENLGLVVRQPRSSLFEAAGIT